MDDRVPPRSAIDPLEFPALLPNIILLDRVPAPTGDRFRFRLIGTQVVDIADQELTGRFLDEALPSSYAEFVALPHRLVMPLRRDGDSPDTIFVGQFWQRRSDNGYWTGDWRSAKPEIVAITSLQD